MNGRLESCLCSICMNTSESCSNWTIFFLGTLHVQNILCDWCDKINYLRQDTRLCTAPFSTFKSFEQKSSLKVGKKCVHFATLKRILRINCLAKNSLLRNMNRGKKIKQNNVVECSCCVTI